MRGWTGENRLFRVKVLLRFGWLRLGGLGCFGGRRLRVWHVIVHLLHNRVLRVGEAPKGEHRHRTIFEVAIQGLARPPTSHFSPWRTAGSSGKHHSSTLPPNYSRF